MKTTGSLLFQILNRSEYFTQYGCHDEAHSHTNAEQLTVEGDFVQRVILREKSQEHHHHRANYVARTRHGTVANAVAETSCKVEGNEL